MLVLSVGMPRAGSGWHYNLVHDLVVAGGGQDARHIRHKYLLAPVLTEVNCNIGVLSMKRLLPVMLPVFFGNTFTVKAHAGLTPFALSLIRKGFIRPTYIYRDPRAALLSAYEYGQRGLEQGRKTAFSNLENIEQAIQFMRPYIRIWEQWTSCQQALQVRYEDMLVDYEQEIRRLLSFLGLELDPTVAKVIEKYRPGQTSKQGRGLHFHKGQAERFRQVLSGTQLAACNQVFEPFLTKMGYQID